ncbi:hypothetical protein FACS1894208_02460 [Clostridia bacterium]|nr:hypothetical protein FACS1894208_02460 [Clostridia bacterium]
MNTSPKWDVIHGKTAVIVCAEKRPTYECSRDWEKAFRKEVQDALRVLTANEGEILTARYGTTADDTVDLENALFYNFSAPVKNAARYGIEFGEIDSEEVAAIFNTLGVMGYKHLYLYSVAPIDPPDIFENDTYIEWNEIPVKTMLGAQSAFGYFTAMRSHPECFLICNTGQIDGDFGLDIKIQSPETEPVSLTGIMKPLIDGIVSSFHKLPDNSPIDKLTDSFIELFLTTEKMAWVAL